MIKAKAKVWQRWQGSEDKVVIKVFCVLSSHTNYKHTKQNHIIKSMTNSS